MRWFQNILVGFLFFGALALVGYFTIISDTGPFAKQGERMVVFFENADGLKTGSRVTVLGVPLGNIVSIDLVSVDAGGKPVISESERVGQKVAVTLELRQPVIFFENYNIALKSESLLSDRIIAIDPGSTKPDDNGKIPSQIQVFSTTNKEMKEKGKSALTLLLSERKSGKFADLEGETAGDPLSGIATLIEENRDEVKRTITNVAEITNKINNGKGTLGLLVNDDELHKNANTLITDAQVVVKEVRESLEDTREQAPVNSFIRAILTAF